MRIYDQKINETDSVRSGKNRESVTGVTGGVTGWTCFLQRLPMRVFLTLFEEFSTQKTVRCVTGVTGVTGSLKKLRVRAKGNENVLPLKVSPFISFLRKVCKTHVIPVTPVTPNGRTNKQSSSYRKSPERMKFSASYPRRSPALCCFFMAFWVCLLLPVALRASGWDTTYKEIEANIRIPEFADRTYDITTYGASLQATAARNQEAINKAIETCSKEGGGRVVIPAGTWKTGAIRLKSHVNLVVEKDATLFFEFDETLYPIVETRWEGLDCMNYSPLIYAYGETDIALTGEGTLDGNGSNDTWWQLIRRNPKEREGTEKLQNLGGSAALRAMGEEGVPLEERVFGPGKGLRPQLVNLCHCDGILIDGITLLRSPFWVIHPLLSRNITVRNIYVENNAPNGDGCDPEACENVLIENCIFSTGDDCIAIKSGRNEDGREGGKGRYAGIPSKNIIVRNCLMKDGHGGVVIGSEVSGGCNNVYVENCRMDSPHLERVLRIKTNSLRGGVIEHIYMRNVEVGRCVEAVLKINLDYDPKEVGRRGFYPTVRNVYMENVTCKKSKYGIRVIGFDDRVSVYNINVKNCQFDGVSDEPIYRTGRVEDMKFDNLCVNGSPVL